VTVEFIQMNPPRILETNYGGMINGCTVSHGVANVGNYF
jgi:hypothetical protein